MEWEWQCENPVVIRKEYRITLTMFNDLVMLAMRKRVGKAWTRNGIVSQARMIKQMVARGLILEDNGAVCITDRGVWVLNDLQTPRKRFDGVCPNCKSAMRGKMGYCVDCAREKNKALYKKRRHHNAIHKGCVMCGAPRHVSSTGIVYTPYCLPCLKAKDKVWKSKRGRNAKEMICKNCGTQGVHETETLIHPLCKNCFADKQKTYSANTKRKRLAKALYKAHSTKD